MSKDTQFYNILNFVLENKHKLDDNGLPVRFYTDNEYIELIKDRFSLDTSESISYYNSIMSKLI